jgi:hypothetical protein
MKGVLALNRTERPSEPAGRILNAQQFAEEICCGHVSAKYIVKHFRDVGSKPGKEWLWHEADARAAWAKRMPRRVA